MRTMGHLVKCLLANKKITQPLKSWQTRLYSQHSTILAFHILRKNTVCKNVRLFCRTDTVTR